MKGTGERDWSEQGGTSDPDAGLRAVQGGRGKENWLGEGLEEVTC